MYNICHLWILPKDKLEDGSWPLEFCGLMSVILMLFYFLGCISESDLKYKLIDLVLYIQWTFLYLLDQ